MPLPDADKKSPRVYTLLQNQDLENITADTLASVADPMAIEEANEDELRRLCLVAFARMVTKGSFDGWLSSGGGGDGYSAVLTSYDWNEADRPILLASLPPYGCGTRAYVSSGSNNQRTLWPFISPTSGSVSSVNLYVNGATSAGSVDIGFYTDDDGKPKTLIGECTIVTTGAGIITQTSFTDTITLVKGTQYWVGQFNDGFGASVGTFSIIDRQQYGSGLGTANNGLQGTNISIQEAGSSGNASISSWTGFTQSTTNPMNIGVLF